MVSDHLSVCQIIRRARQNYLLEQYREKKPAAAQILQDVLSARGVRHQTFYSTKLMTNESVIIYRCGCVIGHLWNSGMSWAYSQVVKFTPVWGVRMNPSIYRESGELWLWMSHYHI